MSIDLSKFYDDAVSIIPIDGTIEAEGLNIRGRKINFLDLIRYSGDICRIDGEKILHIKIYYRYTEICGRCLEPFIDDGKAIVSAKLIDKKNLDPRNEEEVIYYMEEKLDLQEYIIDAIVLSLPMKPLCDERCKGLCSRCGANNNNIKCDCVIEDIDPRFEKLKDFFPNK